MSVKVLRSFVSNFNKILKSFSLLLRMLSSKILFLLQYCSTRLMLRPYLAIRTTQKLIQDKGSHLPLASIAMKDQIYVDVLQGAGTVEKALELQHDCAVFLGKGGFTLRKWSNNHKSLLQTFPNDHLETPLTLSSREQPIFRILGIK